MKIRGLLSRRDRDSGEVADPRVQARMDLAELIHSQLNSWPGVFSKAQPRLADGPLGGQFVRPLVMLEDRDGNERLMHVNIYASGVMSDPAQSQPLNPLAAGGRAEGY